ncbi:MAG: hypothetical protein JJ896_03980 [Rhodothermales bacterium]|nr:hypothetical protein [Rhodothermales bacterium]MBO6778795.1 hypothetical protein [Rhodothermales bacterium]
MKKITSTALAFLVAIGLAGCDFQAAEDAFDNFDIIIELEPINTVVNGIVTDNATGELVAARLSFSGSGAGTVIDAYSDPLTEINAEDGVVTFGIQNSVTPSESAPVEITVTAEADGYFDETVTVEITETGDTQFSVSLNSENVTATAARGTAVAQDNSGSSDASGNVQQTVTVQTQQSAQSTATASVTVPQGARPLTAAGTPLTGQLTTELKSYDSATGLQALPAKVRLGADGSNQAVAGAAYFKLVDRAGNVAVTVQPASSGGVASKSAGVCVGGATITIRNSDPAQRAIYDLIVASGQALFFDVFAFTPADGQTNQVGTVQVEEDGAGLKADLCLGGGTGSTGVIDTGAIGNPAGGIFFSVRFQTALTSSGPLDHSVTFAGISGTKNIVLNLIGNGINLTATKSIRNGSYKLSTLLNAGGDYRVVNNTTYTLRAVYSGSSETVDVTFASPLTGTSSLTMPALSDLSTYNVVAALACPAGQQFEVQITSGSLDAVSAFYRIAGVGAPWTVLPKSAITSKEATANSIRIAGSLDLKANTQYRFKGVLGSDAATTLATSPAAGQTFNITLSVDEVGIECVSE